MREGHPIRTPPLRRFSTVWREGAPGARSELGPTHRNPGYELTWVHAGAVSFELERDRVGAGAGGSVLLLPGELNTPRATGALHQIMLAPELLQEAAAELGGRLPARAGALPAACTVTELAALIGRARRRASDGDPLIARLIDALALALVRPREGVGAGARAGRRPDAAVRRALEYMADHYAERLGVDDIARAAGLSRFALMHRFRAQVGASVHQHLTALRLERAAHDLRHSTRSVLEIALAHGFADPSRFARAFARAYGVAPRAFRTTRAP